MKYASLLSAFLLTTVCLNAQVLPKPGAALNYNQVMFDYPKIRGAETYEIELTDDTSASAFTKQVTKLKDSATSTMKSGLVFGKKYQWRYAGVKKGKPMAWNGPYTFSLVPDTLSKYNLLNFEIIKNDSPQTAGGLIVNDCTHTITDRDGNLVWYLPNIKWHMKLERKNISVKPLIMDVRLNPAGTITYLADTLATECDLNGKPLWRGPNDGKVSGGSTESYNHDFKRLPDGHYMVLGNQLWRKLPPYHDTTAVYKKFPARQIINDAEYGRTEFGTVIEYDKRGKVVWSWNSENYLDPDALKPRKDSFDFPFELKPHINAFCTDPKNEFVYVSFRDLNRIIKIEKKTGKVVDSWGDKNSSSQPAKLLPINRQHSVNLMKDGSIAVFNNNDQNVSDSLSSVILFSENGTINWQMKCDFDPQDRVTSRNGGNVDELKNGNLLVCMGNLNRIFEVTRSKKIVWEARLTTNGKTGDMFYHRLYRAHAISSLYPCWFSAITSEDTLPAGISPIHVKIFNKGTEDDSYNVAVMSATGNFNRQVTTANVLAGKSVKVELLPERALHAGDMIEVTVSSATNPDFQRRSIVKVVN